MNTVPWMLSRSAAVASSFVLSQRATLPAPTSTSECPVDTPRHRDSPGGAAGWSLITATRQLGEQREKPITLSARRGAY